MQHDFSEIPGLHLVDLDQELPGQRRFIGCWVWCTPALCFVVDPGPPATGQSLVRALEELDVERLDFVLLTHIHLDHAGATAAVLERWPAARVICHPRGRAHLADPDRLWAGSLAVLGKKAYVYGEPSPVPGDALADYGEITAYGIQVIETPGHAPHHLCFRHQDRLFLGEAAGTFSTRGRGSDTARPYLRPATPPRFILAVAQASLQRLLALAPAPRVLLFAHHGLFNGDVRGLLETAHDQLGSWVAVCRELATGRDNDEALLDAVVAALMHRDPCFARGAGLAADIRVREHDFTRQTLRGMLGYLRS